MEVITKATIILISQMEKYLLKSDVFHRMGVTQSKQSKFKFRGVN